MRTDSVAQRAGSAALVVALLLVGCVTPGTDLEACARRAARAALAADLNRISADAYRMGEMVVSRPDKGRVLVEVTVLHCPPFGDDVIICTPRGGWILTVVDLGLGCRVVPPIGQIVG
jgi:starvation-inducible outer membrane lipoprotein